MNTRISERPSKCRKPRRFGLSALRRLGLATVMLVCAASVNGHAFGQSSDGYLVEQFVPNYQHRLPELPGVGIDITVEPTPGAGEMQFRLDLPLETPTVFSRAAIDSICEQLRAEVLADLADPSHGVHTVMVNPGDVDPMTGEDVRGDRRIMRLMVVVDGPTYDIGSFSINYFPADVDEGTLPPGLPDTGLMGGTPVRLYRTPEGTYAGWRMEGAEMTTLGALESAGTQRYHASAVLEICRSVAAHLSDEFNIVGSTVAPDPQQIDVAEATLDDLRGGATDLNLLVLTGRVTQVRTIASGDRVPDDERIDNPRHDRIRTRSPLDRGSVLDKEDLDNYIFRLNRHPGRQVDVALSAGEGTGGVTLDYLVGENKPWFLYGQISNTGTRQTDRIRERVGFIHNQLTSELTKGRVTRDDILNIDFITTQLDESNALLVSYERPIGDTDNWRFRVSGSWSEYTASEVGFAGEQFEGQSYSLGADAIVNVYQNRELFIDLFFGATWQNHDVVNNLVNIAGEEDFLFPHIGATAISETEQRSTRAQVQFEFLFDALTSVDSGQLNNLGRLFPDDEWIVLSWDAEHSFFLEPFLHGDSFADPTTASSSTLAHELAFQFRGQYTFGDDRLIPQAEMVAGGLYSVRGYPESVVAGDSVLLGTVEYRYHVPRAFGIARSPADDGRKVAKAMRRFMGEDFRFSPQQVYGRPDWDLILRGFVDVGHTMINDSLSFENDETLIGVGVGVELQLKQNVNLRADWGFALEDLPNQNVNDGSNRLHVVATIIF